MPQWSTPSRLARLVKLQSQESPTRCPFGEDPCPAIARFGQAIRDLIGEPDGPAWIIRAALATPKVLAKMPLADLPHLPFWLIRDWIALWKAEDREAVETAWREESRRLHALFNITHRGQFDSIARDEFFLRRPVWSIKAMGVGAFTFKRVAKVEIHGLHRDIWVNLGGMDKLSKNKKHKILRYGKGMLPRELEQTVSGQCSQAVKRFLDS